MINVFFTERPNLRAKHQRHLRNIIDYDTFCTIHAAY